jgi:RND family efflux transporter, MFP subunit
MQKNFRVVGLWVILSACIIVSSCNRKAEDTKEIQTFTASETETVVDTLHLHLQDFNRQIVCNGQMRAKEKSALSFTNADQITDIYVKNGQRVAKGTIIACTDKREKIREVERAEHELERARVELTDKLISLGYDGSLEGIPNDVLKRAEVTSGFYTAKYALQSAQTALDECNLRAPFSGRIANLEGRTYQRNDKLCTLIDDSQFEVEFKILEAELANVKMEQKVLVSPFINEEKQYVGKISSINPMVDEKGLVLVTAKIDNTRGDNDMMDGQNVKVVVEEEVRRMFVVPKDAVVERDGYHVVFLYKDGHAVWTYVDILHSNINSYAITGCARKETTINEGDVIITSGNLNLADDTEVKINNQ